MELATNIFNEKGEHKLEHLKKVIRTEVKIDFWEESVKIYVTIPQADRQNENSENKLIGNVVNGRIRQRIIFKRFKVSEDFENQVEYALKNIHRTRKRYKVNARKLVLSVVCAILFITTGIIVYAMSNKPQEPEVTQTIIF